MPARTARAGEPSGSRRQTSPFERPHRYAVADDLKPSKASTPAVIGKSASPLEYPEKRKFQRSWRMPAASIRRPARPNRDAG